MRYQLISLMRAGAEALTDAGEEMARDYALHEAANNMIELLTGQCTLDEFRACYTADGSKPLDLEAHFPLADDD